MKGNRVTVIPVKYPARENGRDNAWDCKGNGHHTPNGSEGPDPEIVGLNPRKKGNRSAETRSVKEYKGDNHPGAGYIGVNEKTDRLHGGRDHQKTLLTVNVAQPRN